MRKAVFRPGEPQRDRSAASRETCCASITHETSNLSERTRCFTDVGNRRATTEPKENLYDIKTPHVADGIGTHVHAPNHTPAHPHRPFFTAALIIIGIILLAAAAGMASILATQKSKATYATSDHSAAYAHIDESDADADETLPAIDWNYWAETNPDIVAWLVIPDTSISYPVAFAPQREDGYYLTHDAYATPNIYGCPYISNGCAEGLESDNVLILGHNMSDGTMFAELLSYGDYAFLDEHRRLYLLTPSGATTYAISHAITVESPLSIERSDAKTITLATCAHTYDSPDRLVVVAHAQ